MRHEMLTHCAFFFALSNAKKKEHAVSNMLSQHFVTRVVPPLGCDMYTCEHIT